MELPFTHDQFFGVFAGYNDAIYPLQIVVHVAGLFVLGVASTRELIWRRVTLWFLAACWIWTGIAYHIVWFAPINSAAYFFGGLFVLQGGLIAVTALRVRSPTARRSRAALWMGLILAAYGVLVYPTLTLIDHGYPNAPMFGVTPCPLTIFTIGVFLMMHPRIPRYLLAIPLIWSVIGGSAAVLLGVPQDYGLMAAGAAGVVGLLLMRGKANGGKQVQD